MEKAMVGVIFNSGAGKADKFNYVGSYLDKIFEKDIIITGSSIFGKDYIKNAKEVKLSSTTCFSYEAHKLIKAFYQHCVDKIISIGGDGTHSFVATEMIKMSVNIPLICIAGGSANVGPLLSYSISNLQEIKKEYFATNWHSCLEVLSGKKALGYAFNDIVLGDTFLGSKGGEICNYCAKAFYNNNELKVKNPSDNLMNSNLEIIKNEKDIFKLMRNYSRIVVAPIIQKHDYIGKAICGILCLASFFDMDYCVSLSNIVLVDGDLSNKDSNSTTQQILLKGSDTITITGINNDTYVMIDGNVHKSKYGEITIKFRESIISTQS